MVKLGRLTHGRDEADSWFLRFWIGLRFKARVGSVDSRRGGVVSHHTSALLPPLPSVPNPTVCTTLAPPNPDPTIFHPPSPAVLLFLTPKHFRSIPPALIYSAARPPPLVGLSKMQIDATRTSTRLTFSQALIGFGTDLRNGPRSGWTRVGLGLELVGILSKTILSHPILSVLYHPDLSHPPNPPHSVIRLSIQLGCQMHSRFACLASRAVPPASRGAITWQSHGNHIVIT